MENILSPIIQAGEAGLYINNPDVIFVDARGGPDAFARYHAGHVPGAVFVDLENELSKKSEDASRGGRHPLPDPGDFASTLGKLGISSSTHVLVYDDKAGANAAARFWWMMRAAGHRRIQVIDGGYTSITDAGLPISKQIEKPLPATKPYPFTRWQLPTTDMETVATAANENDHLVIDVRESYRYRGEREPIDLVAGHIPGALNIPYLDNLQADGRFRSPGELATQYEAVIGKRDKSKVIVHCGSGVTACHTLLAMEYAGMSGASLYIGSWSEWSRNNKPVGTQKS